RARGGLGEQRAELVAAHPRQDVGLAEGLVEDLRELRKRPVARRVTELVVDALHIVEVDEQDDHVAALALRDARVLLAERQQTAPVVEAREIVAQRELAKVPD